MQCLFNSIRQKNLSLIQSLMKSFKPNVGHRYSEDAGGKALHTTVSEEEMQALLNAVELGDSSLVRSLIKSNRVDIDYGFDGHYGNTLLHTAAIVGSLDIVKILVEEGHASVNWGNQFDDVPIQYAAFEKHLDIVRYLSEISGIGVTVEQLSKPLAEKPV